MARYLRKARRWLDRLGGRRKGQSKDSPHDHDSGEAYFSRTLSEGVAQIAATRYSKPAIVRGKGPEGLSHCGSALHSFSLLCNFCS